MTLSYSSSHYTSLGEPEREQRATCVNIPVTDTSFFFFLLSFFVHVLLGDLGMGAIVVSVVGDGWSIIEIKNNVARNLIVSRTDSYQGGSDKAAHGDTRTDHPHTTRTHLKHSP